MVATNKKEKGIVLVELYTGVIPNVDVVLYYGRK